MTLAFTPMLLPVPAIPVIPTYSFFLHCCFTHNTGSCPEAVPSHTPPCVVSACFPGWVGGYSKYLGGFALPCPTFRAFSLFMANLPTVPVPDGNVPLASFLLLALFVLQMEPNSFSDIQLDSLFSATRNRRQRPRHIQISP